MRGIAILTAVVALAACAPSNASTGTSPTVGQTVRVSTSQGTLSAQTHTEIGASGSSVAFPLDRVWAVLPSVYDSLTIPVTTRDQQNHVIGNPDAKLKRRLGDVPLAKYLDCGSTLGSPNTDTYEIRLSVLTEARRDTVDGGTSVMTTLDAKGRSITIAAEYSPCRSTGALEKKIVELVKARLK
ncbi:MAG TPA: hypothetical protein VIV65_01920 [Gemmatimonadaceae bacterium]|jgi:hypothetical protein